MDNKLTGSSQPSGLTGRLLKRMPGGAFIKEQLDRVENIALGELKQRLDRLERSPTVSVVAVSVSNPGRGPDAPGTLLASLLAQSGEQSREQAVDAYYASLLRNMVPDQARILAALSDGSAYPMVHLYATSRLGLTAVPIVEYVSSVGRAAGVLGLELTPLYVRQLAQWGLTESAPEDPAQTTAYEILETDDGVRKAIARIDKRGERSRIVRRSLKISDFGQAMWNRCQLDDNPAQA